MAEAQELPESLKNETSHLLAKIEEIKNLSDSFPYIPSSLILGDTNYWIKEPNLEHWEGDFDTWDGEWGVASRGHRINGYPAQIIVAGPSTVAPRISVEITPDYGDESMTFETEREAEDNPAFRSYEFEEDGQISKKRYLLLKPTIEEMLPGDYETLGFALASVKNALMKARE